ncbi:MAG: LacI family DNA-binding transcriptional regulator [Geodermatophilaceae bacterium]
MAVPSDGREPTVRPDPGVSRTKVTISDVAAYAGVSISTVSHALSGNRTISAATQARVREAITALGYGANPTARSLRTGRSGIVGLILRPRDAVHGSLRGTETFTRLSGAIATAVLDRGIGLMHVPDILDPAAARVPMDGCIVAHPYGQDEVLAELLRRGVPVVTVEEDPDHPDFPWAVRLDYDTVLTELLDGLHARGSERIALVTGTEDNTWNRRTREIYIDWANRHEMPVRHSALYEGLGVAGAEEFIVPILADAARPDTVITGPSPFAAGIAHVAEKLGLSIPEDLMLAAVTDSEFSRGNDPPITAVDLSLEDLARHAVDLMLDQLAGGPPPERPIVVQPVLHWRGSTSA